MKKFLIGAAACAAMILPATAGATEYPLGDLNCSGAVTSTDISIMTYVVVGGARPAGCNTPIDLDCSGGPSAADVSIIVYIAAGGDYSQTC